MKRRSSLVLAGALIALGATGANAQLLSVEELKECLLQKQSLDEQKADIDRRQASLADARSTLDRVERDVDERRTFMSSNDDRLRSEYQSLLAQERRMSRLYADDLEAHNQHVAAYNEAREVYMSGCGSRTYNDANMSRAKRELGMQ